MRALPAPLRAHASSDALAFGAPRRLRLVAHARRMQSLALLAGVAADLLGMEILWRVDVEEGRAGRIEAPPFRFRDVASPQLAHECYQTALAVSEDPAGGLRRRAVADCCG